MADQTDSIASNVARLRSDNGLSQEQLAKRASITRVAIGKIERGEVVPRAKTIDSLARALGVPLRELVSYVEPVSNVRFRARKRVNSREQILAETSSWLYGYNWLEQETKSSNVFRLAALVGKYSNPIKLAKEARETLDLSPDESIRDVCGLLEDNGVKVLQLKKATGAFFGLSVGIDDNGPAVVVNTWDRISVERWIFTAAHELGHILLHKDAYDRSHSQEVEQEEQEADLFAGYFLMPESGFNKEWEQSRGLSLLNRVLKLKRIYRVSYKTVLYRLRQSNRENTSVWAAFQAQHKHRFGKTLRRTEEPQGLPPSEFRDKHWKRSDEPDGLSESDFLQDHLQSLVRYALDDGVISLGRAAEILRMSRDDMRRLTSSWA